MVKETLFDPVRQKWVPKTPEEELRQRVLQWLLSLGGFSRHEILVEKSLHDQLGFNKAHGRRFDIACIRLISTHQIEWLCLIECKASIQDELSLQATWRQIEGYSSFLPVRPKALALASPQGCWYCETDPRSPWRSGLPHRQGLLNPTL
jgi:hypothetical protein